VYGQPVKKLKSVAFGVQIYMFANRMQIKLLPAELDKLFKDTKAADIFAVFNLYQLINNQLGLDTCKHQVWTTDLAGKYLYVRRRCWQ
jgi:hypothetical protein